MKPAYHRKAAKTKVKKQATYPKSVIGIDRNIGTTQTEKAT
jgi:hypothetical protein